MNPQPTKAWRKAAIADWLTENNIPFSDKLLHGELYDLARRNKKPPMYLPDEEARKRGHIVLRLPPYHCQYNPIELIWGLMKRYYDKHIIEYGEFTEQKCLRVWNEAIDSITPAVWKKVAAKVDRLVCNDWELYCSMDKCDLTDYSTLKFCPSDSDSDSDSEFENELNPEDDDDPDDPLPLSDNVLNEAVPLSVLGPSLTTAPQKQGCRKNLNFQVSPSVSAKPTEKTKQNGEPYVDLDDLDQLWSAKLCEDILEEDKIACQMGSVTVRNRDLATLNEGKWLNDEVINAYMNLLETYFQSLGIFVKAFNTFFYVTFLRGSHFAVSKWSKQVDIFKCDFIVFPIHLKEKRHWAMVVADVKKKEVQYFDSCLFNGTLHTKAILDYLRLEAAANDKPFDERDWKRKDMKGIPIQLNGFDCGMFASTYAFFAISGTQLTWKNTNERPPFSQEDMPQLRMQMKNDIVKKCLQPPVTATSHQTNLPVPASVHGTLLQKPVKKASTGHTGATPKKKRTRLAGQNDSMKVPCFKKKVDENKPTSTDGAYLITSSHVNLRSSQFTSANSSQALYIYCYAMVSLIDNWRIFSCHDLNSFMFNGSNMFVTMNGKPNEFPVMFDVSRHSFAITVCEGLNGTFSAVDRAQKIAEHLRTVVDRNVFFVFRGQGRSVCIWPALEPDRYYLFNAYCVDTNNAVCNNVRTGFARLFKCVSQVAVANLVLRTHVFDTSLYQIYHVKVTKG